MQRSKDEIGVGPTVSLFLSLVLVAGVAGAQESNEEKPADPDTGESTVEERTLGLLPQPFASKGIKISATYINEILSNPTGGIHQGTIGQGRLNLAADVDFSKVGWQGLSAHANIFAIHGPGLSRSNLLNYFVTSGIEAVPTVRLYEAYFEQKFFSDKLSVRFGQFAADSEFITSRYTDVFTNATFGWPAFTSLNLPSGGPSPPLAAVGTRVFVKVSKNVSILGAVFDGDAAGPGVGDPQRRNKYGLDFRVRDKPLTIGETQYRWAQDSDLPGALKFGGWAHFGTFNDERYDENGVSLADPASTGIARKLQGNQGSYVVAEQRLYTLPDDNSRGVGVFVRAASGFSDRNLLDRYADAGINFNGVLNRRPHDKLGIALGYARTSHVASMLDMDFQQFYRASWPVRGTESLFTVSYQYEITPGWNLLPAFQYIHSPGGGATDPLSNRPRLSLKDAVVISLRSVLKF